MGFLWVGGGSVFIYYYFLPLLSLSIQGTRKSFLLPSLHHAPLWSELCASSSKAGRCIVVRKIEFSGQSLNVSLSLRTIYVLLNKALGNLQEVFPTV